MDGLLYFFDFARSDGKAGEVKGINDLLGGVYIHVFARCLFPVLFISGVAGEKFVAGLMGWYE